MRKADLGKRADPFGDGAALRLEQRVPVVSLRVQV